MWLTGQGRETVIRAFKYIALLTLLLAPIAVYVFTFGINLSDSHSRWAEMGSAMSGIYGPVLAILGYRLLVVQLKLQMAAMKLQQQTTIMQEQTTRHMFDQAYLARTSEDIAFYLEKLETALGQSVGPGKDVGAVITEIFAQMSREQLDGPGARTDALFIQEHYPKVVTAWSSILAVFAGLNAVDEEPFRLHLGSAQQRAAVSATWATCAALDHCVYCASEGRTRGPYRFSPYLSNYAAGS